MVPVINFVAVVVLGLGAIVSLLSGQFPSAFALFLLMWAVVFVSIWRHR